MVTKLCGIDVSNKHYTLINDGTRKTRIKTNWKDWAFHRKNDEYISYWILQEIL